MRRSIPSLSHSLGFLMNLGLICFPVVSYSIRLHQHLYCRLSLQIEFASFSEIASHKNNCLPFLFGLINRVTRFEKPPNSAKPYLWLAMARQPAQFIPVGQYLTLRNSAVFINNRSTHLLSLYFGLFVGTFHDF